MLIFGFLSCAGLNQVTSTFWNRSQSFTGGDQAAIPHLKEHIQSFHMSPITQKFNNEKALFWAHYTFKCFLPRKYKKFTEYH